VPPTTRKSSRNGPGVRPSGTPRLPDQVSTRSRRAAIARS
jgi:hypothetical protein